MTIKAKVVLELLKALAEEAEAELDYGGFKKMEEFLERDEITQKYLDDTHRRVHRALDQDKLYVRTWRSKLNIIAAGLMYKNLLEFEHEVLKPIDPILKNCLGKWWSLVRGNTGDLIYKAPVRIKLDQDNNIVMTLLGQTNRFSGKVRTSAGSIFCDLDSQKGKKLHLIFKGNVNPDSRVLQGIFSGISSTGDPIGGREILMRETKLNMDEMKWRSHALDDEALDPRIRKYFKTPEGNCIKIDNMADLG